MQDFPRTARASARARRLFAPALALAALSLTAQAAFAFGGTQPKPQLKVEAERSPQGARLTFKGKDWPAGARIKITATRAPGAAKPQDFGMFTADAKGALAGNTVTGCTTSRAEDAQMEMITFTAADSATGVKATTKVEGGAWICM